MEVKVYSVIGSVSLEWKWKSRWKSRFTAFGSVSLGSGLQRYWFSFSRVEVKVYSVISLGSVSLEWKSRFTALLVQFL